MCFALFCVLPDTDCFSLQLNGLIVETAACGHMPFCCMSTLLVLDQFCRPAARACRRACSAFGYLLCIPQWVCSSFAVSALHPRSCLGRCVPLAHLISLRGLCSRTRQRVVVMSCVSDTDRHAPFPLSKAFGYHSKFERMLHRPVFFACFSQTVQ